MLSARGPGPRPNGIGRVGWSLVSSRDRVFDGGLERVARRRRGLGGERLARAAGEARGAGLGVGDRAEALQRGETFYTWQRGIPPLREAIAKYTADLYGIKCGPERITVTSSGMQAIALTCQALIDPGDNVAVLSPVWPNISSAIAIMRGEARHVLLDRHPDGRWTLDLDRLFAAVDARTRAIFVNSPNNPTGWVMSSDEQRAILDFARKRGIWVMADEVYARIVYDHPHAPSFLEHADDKIGQAPASHELAAASTRRSSPFA